MHIPRFSRAFNERIAGRDLRTAFETFAVEVLAARHLGHVAVDYKELDDDVDAPRKAWETVASRLWRYLADSTRPRKPRYAGWYATGADAMTAYRFVTDGWIGDRNRIEPIETEMRAFFQKLAAREHLKHLGALDVGIVDWMEFSAELRRRPDLLFRWFPSTRPRGLMPLDDDGEGPPFRSFLTNASPYYSRRAHAVAFPDAAGAPPLEDDLLSLLDQQTGLIVTGRGGAGKTRLTRELGKRARENGWLVVRASADFGDAAVDQLLTHFGTPGKALLLIDQLEAVPREPLGSFPDRVEYLERLNARLPHRIRYIANCRTSYYRKVEAIPNHAHVDVSPVTGPFAGWLEDYRRAAVRNVLTAAGIEVTPARLQVCSDVPLFAVVMAFLQRGGRTDDLRDFVTDGDLGLWFTRHILQSLARPVRPELATLIAAFPMNDKQRHGMPGTRRKVLDLMVAEQWVEKIGGGADGPRWPIAHDVLADCVILRHLEHLGADTSQFIDALFDFAEANGAMAQVLAALQRIAGSRTLLAVEWTAIFAKWLSRFTPQWLEVARFLYSAFLAASDDRALVEEPLKRWLALHAETESAQFICVAWLKAGGDRALVEEPLRRWLVLHAESEAAYSAYGAWLGAGGDRAVVEEPLRRWLARHAEAREAGLVFTAWLEAGGDPALVEEPLRRWLMVHPEADVAGLVYGAWLEAGGARGLVEFPLVRWLTRHPQPDLAGLSRAARLKRKRAFNAAREVALAAMARLRESTEGSFPAKALTKQSLPNEAVLDILTWCRRFARNEDALWRLSQLEERIARPGVASEGCDVAELVLDPWLDPASSPTPRIANNVTRVLACMTHFDDPALHERADSLLARWLRHPHGFNNSDWNPPACVTALVAEVRALIARGVIDMTADASAIERFADWKRRMVRVMRRARGPATQPNH